MFRKIAVPPFSASSSQAALLKLPDPEDDGTAIFRNVVNSLPSDTKRPRRLETAIHIKFREKLRGNNNFKYADVCGRSGWVRGVD